jgi:hypothetical protein
MPERVPLSNLGMRRVYANASMLLGRRIKLCRIDQLQIPWIPRHCRRNNGSDHLTAPPGALLGGSASLVRAAASGTKWMGFSQAGRVIAQLLGMVILARLLSPTASRVGQSGSKTGNH